MVIDPTKTRPVFALHWLCIPRSNLDGSAHFRPRSPTLGGRRQRTGGLVVGGRAGGQRRQQLLGGGRSHHRVDSRATRTVARPRNSRPGQTPTEAMAHLPNGRSRTGPPDCRLTPRLTSPRVPVQADRADRPVGNRRSFRALRSWRRSQSFGFAARLR